MDESPRDNGLLAETSELMAWGLCSVVKRIPRRCSLLTYYNHVSDNDSSDDGKCLL